MLSNFLGHFLRNHARAVQPLYTVKKFKPGYDDLVLEYQELDSHYELSFQIDIVGLKIPRVGFVKPNFITVYRFKPTFGLMMLCLGIQVVHRVYTEQFRVYTESTQSNLGTTQSLHRAIRIYTESTQSAFGSTQSLHRVNQVYTESTQSDAGLHRINTE